MAKLGRLLISWMVVVGIVFPALSTAAQQATPTSDEGVYRDPGGRFTVPIPTNWTVESSNQIAVMRDPDEALAVYFVVVQADAIDDAIPMALAPIDPPFLLDEIPDANQSVPSSTGVDETAIVTFVSPDQSDFVQIVGQRVGGTVYCMVFTGSFDAAAKRDSQIQIIASGFTILSLEEIDLSRVVLAELSPELLLELEEYVQTLLHRLDVPGASMAIVANGEIVYANGFGVKELGSSDPVTAETQMMIGSVTKSMTTMMMATEVDDGLMRWDEPVVEILPEFAVADPALTDTITVRNLVCACTGVPRRDLEFVFNAHNLTAEDVIASLQDFQFYTGFGEAFQYSNQMVAAGGYVAAAAMGGTYGELFDSYVAAMQERVFDPIGMPGTTLSFETVKEGGDYAIPHGASLGGGYVPISLDLEETLTPVAPAGLIWSTANDMARYLITELNEGAGPDGNRVVSSQNLGETWVPQVAVNGASSYGLGWFLEERGGVRLIHHGGNTFGFTSDLSFLPDKEIGIVVLANGQSANLFTEGVRIRLLELLFDRPQEHDAQIGFFLEQAEATGESIRAQIQEVPREIGVEVSGVYVSDVLGQIELTFNGKGLVLDAGEFQVGLKTQIGASTAEDILFVAAGAPIAGAIFTLEQGTSGRRDLVLALGAETYTFVHRSLETVPGNQRAD